MHQVTMFRKFLPSSSYVCVLLHSILSLTSSNSITMDKMLDKVAHYMRFKDFEWLKKNLTNRKGMEMERFIGDEIIPYKGWSHPGYPRYKSASIRFKFKAGIETRFETH